MAGKLQAIRGMRDILPGESAAWQHLEAVISEVLEAYGYREIRLPALEKTELFARSIGEVTDSSRRRCTPSPTATARA